MNLLHKNPFLIPFVAVVVHFYMLIVPCQPAIAEAPSLPRSPPVNVISNVCHLSNRPLVFVNILKSICQYPQQKFRVPSLVFTLAPGGCPSSTIPRESFWHENRMLNTCDQGMPGVLQIFADEHFLTPVICSQDVVRKKRHDIPNDSWTNWTIYCTKVLVVTDGWVREISSWITTGWQFWKSHFTRISSLATLLVQFNHSLMYKVSKQP